MHRKTKVSVSKRLAIEQRLLREEKFIVDALRTVKEERYALQREGTDLLCLLQEVLNQGKPSQSESQWQSETSQDGITETAPEPSTSSTNFSAQALDEVTSDVKLDLTVPSHNLYDQDIEEEFEELEDDFEIEMSMLMQGGEKPHREKSPSSP